MTGTLFRLAGLACLLVTLAACTGTDSGLGVDGDDEKAAADARFPEIAGETAPPGAVATSNAPTRAPEIARVHFAPVVGVSVEKIAPLSKRLGPAGSAAGIRLVPAGTEGTTHQLKGYFSAFAENGTTTVIHVWDVITPSGQRVHRIQGQETVSGTATDPWAAVQPATMEAIADKVIAEYAAWVKSGA